MLDDGCFNFAGKPQLLHAVTSFPHNGGSSLYLPGPLKEKTPPPTHSGVQRGRVSQGLTRLSTDCEKPHTNPLAWGAAG
jgi:hypothetical protein